MSEFKLTPDMIGMNNYSDYDPEWCDGHPCPRDCERCGYNVEHRDYVEPDDDDLEMGFDPYLGCYTGDC